MAATFSTEDLATASAPPSDTAAASTPSASPIETSAPEATAAPGPIPYDRHQDIVRRAYAERDALMERFGWAQNITPEQVQQWRTVFELADQHPVEFHQWFTTQLQQHPVHGAALGIHKPQPDLVTEDGKKVYSAEQAERLLQWQLDQAEARWSARLQPFEQQAQVQQATHRAEQAAADELAEAQTWEAFDELRPAILREMQADGRRTLHSAYQKVYREHYLPTRDAKLRQQLLTDLKSKSSASTLSPQSHAVALGEGGKELSWHELFEREFARRKAG